MRLSGFRTVAQLLAGGVPPKLQAKTKRTLGGGQGAGEGADAFSVLSPIDTSAEVVSR